jgi:hypothetical protein
MDSTGKCIINYERALKISPKDEDIQYNLKLARLKVIDNVQPVPSLLLSPGGIIFFFLTARRLGIIALVAIGSLSLCSHCLYIGRRRALNVVAIICLLSSFSSLALAEKQSRQEKNSNEAVVKASSTFVKSAPDPQPATLYGT